MKEDEPDDRFCIRCGRKFTPTEPEAALCPECGGPTSKETLSSPTETIAEPGETLTTPKETVAESLPTITEGKEPRLLEEEVPPTWSAGDMILGLYEVREVIGKGAMGLIYRVHHTGWDMDLAVKSPRPEIVEIAGGVENFTREAEAWVELGLHPHIVTCHYVRNLGGIPRVFAEFVEGGSLSDWIRDGRLYSGEEDEALRRMLDISIQFARGLAYSHSRGLIHQDVKPANVMMTEGGTPKVTDFGLSRARPTEDVQVPDGRGGTVLASSGGMTPAYCSPEQALSSAQAKAGIPPEDRVKLTRRTDTYSYAVSLLEMFTGEVTWASGGAAPYVLKEYLKQDRKDTNLPPMPESAADLLRDCLREDPSERPHDMEEVASSLEDIYREQTGEAYPRERPKEAELLADSLNNRALSLLDLGKREEAEDAFGQALHAQPSHAQSTYNLGLIHWREGKITDDELVGRLTGALSTCQEHSRPSHLLASVHLERDDCEKAIELLEGISDPTPYRREIDDLLDEARERLPRSTRCLRTLEGHTDDVNSVSFSPDGRHALSGSGDETLRLWDLGMGECLRTLEGHEGYVNSVSFSPDGRHALSGSWDEALRLWDLETGKCLRTLEGHEGYVLSVSFSPDGRHALSGSVDRTLRLWDLETGKCLRTLEGHEGPVSSVSFSPDGRCALSGSVDNTLRLWDLETGKCPRTLEGHEGYVNSVSFSPDGRRALSGSWDNTLRLWDLETGKCLRTLEGHTGYVNSVSFSPDGRRALSGSWDETLRLWGLETGECLRTLDGHTGYVYSVSFSPDGRYALSGSLDETLRLWRIETRARPLPPVEICRIMTSDEAIRGKKEYLERLERAGEALGKGRTVEAARLARKARSVPGYVQDPDALRLWFTLYRHLPKKGFTAGWEKAALEGHTNDVNSVSFSPDGRHALSGSWDEALRLWDLETGKCLRTLEGHEGYVLSVSFSPDGRHALSGSVDRTLRLWDLETGKCLRTLEGHEGYVLSVSFSPDGRCALSGSYDNTLMLWDLETGECLRTLEGHTGYVYSVSFSPDGRYALSGSADETLRLWDPETEECLRTLEGHTGPVYSVSFSPDGRHALSGSVDRTLRLWDLETGKCLRTLEGHEGYVLSVSFSPDGRCALSGSYDNTLMLWDLETGKCPRTLEGHTGTVNSVSFSPDGRYALSGSDDDTLRLWALDWELEEREPDNWDEGARPYLEIFLTIHTPYAGKKSLRRKGKPTWTEEDFQRLLYTLSCAGYGWLRPEGVRRKLQEIASRLG